MLITQPLYFRSMGQIFRVRAICDTIKEANEFCAKTPNVGVIAAIDGKPVIADIQSERKKTLDLLDSKISELLNSGATNAQISRAICALVSQID